MASTCHHPQEKVTKTMSKRLISNHLPMDIIATNILPRLLLKPLSRFKCVSKSFNSQISSPELAKLQLIFHSLSVDTDDHLLILAKINGVYSYEFNAISSSQASKLPHCESEVPCVDDRYIFHYPFLGSFHGFLWFSKSYSRELLLYNPLSRMFWEIPLEYGYKGGHIFYEKFGFGFDDTPDDYKIVRVVSRSYCAENSDENGSDDVRACKMKREVMVYRFSEKSWRTVDHAPPYDYSVSENKGTTALIDNHLVHWLFWCASEEKHRIGCFDLKREIWANDVSLPSYYASGSFEIEITAVDVGGLDGCLCLSTRTELLDDSFAALDVWMMKEYGVKESWIKLFRVEYDPDLSSALQAIFPLAYRQGSRRQVLLKNVESDSEEEGILGYHRTKLQWYDVISYKTASVGVASFNGVGEYSKVCLHRQSLYNFPGGRICSMKPKRGKCPIILD